MKLEIYKEAVKRTIKDLGSKALNDFHMVVGMHSEFNELYDAIWGKDANLVNLQEEIIDGCWYSTNYANLQNIEINEIFSFQDELYYDLDETWAGENYYEQLEYAYSKLTNLVKREHIYGKVISLEDKTEAIIEIFKRINDVCIHFNLNVEEGMEKNINKLKVRYPEKFSNWDALNRNLEEEYKQLK